MKLPFSPIPMNPTQRAALATLERTYSPADELRVCAAGRLVYVCIRQDKYRTYLEIDARGATHQITTLGGWIAVYLLSR